MISKAEEEQERLDSYIGKDQLLERGHLVIREDEAAREDLKDKMREAIDSTPPDATVAERIRKLEAIKNEHEVQERARAYRQVEGMGERKAARDRAVAALAAEVKRRNEHYGLDNWTFEEVVDFVLNHAHERYEVD